MDPRLAAEDSSAQQPVRNFLNIITAPLDKSEGRRNSLTNCSFARFTFWGQSHALLGGYAVATSRDEITARAHLQMYALGLTIAALKFQKLGYTIGDDTKKWLSQLDHQAMTFWPRGYLNGNLYSWSGVNAAALAVLTPDKDARAYADHAWRSTLEQVDINGFIKKELSRERRAQIYHQYVLSALVMLDPFRQKLGLGEPRDEERAAILRLAARVTSALCDSSDFAKITGFAQDYPKDWMFQILWTVGLNFHDENWTRCAPALKSPVDPLLGGDLNSTTKMLFNAD